MNLKQEIIRVVTHPFTKKLLVFLIIAALCSLAVLAALRFRPAERTTTHDANTPRAGMPVSVRTIEPNSYPATVTALGEVVPLWQSSIKAQVGGQIVTLSDQLQPGNIVKQGDRLVQIARSNFEMQAAEARSRLASAKVRLLTEQREARDARTNWEQSGIAGAPKSPLVLRGPQLEAAQSDVDAAQAALTHAETLLGYTEISVPYDSVVVQRSVNPGETLFAGDEVAVVLGMDLAEVGVHLDAAQWALLPASIHETKVKLIDPQRGDAWDARVVRESRRLSRDARLRTLYLQVDHPLRQSPPLWPGAFVRAELTGEPTADLLRVPEAALTKQGYVWFVDADNRLRPQWTEPVFYGEGVVYIRTPEALEPPFRVAISPNSSFTRGLAVQPRADEGGR